jgi:glycosyltransferase involved in cell wall biosynthesis
MENRLNQYINNDRELVSQVYFSIVITTFNRAQLLKRALNSLVSQTEEDWEAIIIDDGSIDDTYSQVLPYLRSCSKIKYIWKTHSGEALSKNEGIWSCSGKFVSFLDSDDEYNPNHLELKKYILDQNKNIKFLFGGVKIIGDQYVPDRFNPEKKVNLNNCVIGGTFFVERNLLISLDGYRNIQLGTDADLFERISRIGTGMMETDIPTYIYHHETQDSITNSINSEKQLFKYGN